jgi:hypothetical protein
MTPSYALSGKVWTEGVSTMKAWIAVVLLAHSLLNAWWPIDAVAQRRKRG